MKLQAPKGTRDFYPPQMALRQYLVDAWRQVSVRNGFEQVEGPIFETLDLYKVKSGEGIVSELFHFKDRGERDLAIRPEFTPTLARMVAEQAASLNRPIKWFCTPLLCRAEKPQRGRLREFLQWNCDILGCETAVADAECIFTMVDLLRTLGLTSSQVKVKISHRETVRHILRKLGVPEERMLDAFNLLDGRAKMEPEQFVAAARGLSMSEHSVLRFDQICRSKYDIGRLSSLKTALGGEADFSDLEALDKQLLALGIGEWCEYDLGIVRGLAYYTGTVFEVHETTGVLRAMAGGGRYDKLVELFGGPPLHAVGFGMGDVVLAEVLKDKGLLPADLSQKPDAFVLALTDAAGDALLGVVAQLRTAGLHTRFSYKTTRNPGKLLKEAASSGARYAVILDDQVASRQCQVKNLAGGEQETLTLAELVARLQRS